LLLADTSAREDLIPMKLARKASGGRALFVGKWHEARRSRSASPKLSSARLRPECPNERTRWSTAGNAVLEAWKANAHIEGFQRARALPNSRAAAYDRRASCRFSGGKRAAARSFPL
jgi:hypothetical protein